MRIPLRIAKRFDQWMPFISLVVRATHIRPIPIEALVDTGSPWIAITPKDVLRLGISIKRLKRATKYPIVSLAGHKFERYLLKGTVFVEDEEGQIVRIDMPISILWPTKKRWPDEIKEIPSVLGIDFLTIGRFQLHFNPSKKIAYLERTGLLE